MGALLASLACGDFVDPTREVESGDQALQVEPNDAVLQFVDGSVESGEIGIDGDLSLIASPLGTEAELTIEAGDPCVRGRVDAVPELDFESYWGVWVQLDLARPPFAWAPSEWGVSGFSFRLEGELLPHMRLNVFPPGAPVDEDFHCVEFAGVSGDVIEVRFDRASRGCWRPEGQLFEGSELQAIAWVIPAASASSHEFDFCIREVAPLWD